MIAGLLLAASVLPALAQDENTWATTRGFFFHTPKFELKISTRTQIRYTYTMTDQNSLTTTTAYFNLPRTRLRPRRIRLLHLAQVQGPVRLHGQDAAGASPGRRARISRDLYFDLARNPRATVRLGSQGPVRHPGADLVGRAGACRPIDRLEKFDRRSRQEGAMLWRTIVCEKSATSRAPSTERRNHNANDNTGYMYVARVHFDRTASTSSRVSGRQPGQAELAVCAPTC